MTIFITIISIFALIFLHELGHFLVAKKYGVRVDEFGLGIPPRAYGKKIGETVYSINWLPLGGFVKMHGENERADDERSFSSKPIYQRALIVFAGVAAFFVVAWLIFTTLSASGVNSVIAGGVDKGELFGGARVQVTGVMEESPALGAGVEVGDIIKKIEGEGVKSAVHVTELVNERRGEETIIIMQRDGELVELSIVPRENHAPEKGALGILMMEHFPVYLSPVIGAVMTYEVTAGVLGGFYTLISTLITGQDMPEGMELSGIVGIVGIGADVYEQGALDYLNFLGIITVSLAVLNLLPIPALDGGRLLFLLIEKVKGSPVSEKTEQILIGVSFIMLIILMLVVTYGDITRITSGG